MLFLNEKVSSGVNWKSKVN